MDYYIPKISKQNKFIEGTGFELYYIPKISKQNKFREGTGFELFGLCGILFDKCKFNSKLTYSGQDVEYIETGSFPKEDTNCFREIDTCKAY